MPERILVTRMKAIGDVLFTRPAVAALRAAYPRAHIAFLTGAVTAPLARRFPELDEVLVLDRKAVGWNRPIATVRSVSTLLRALRRVRFDLSIDLHGNAETAFMPFFAGIRERWGWSVGNEYRFWYHHHESVVARPGVVQVRRGDRIEDLHPADWHLEFVRRCGIAAEPRMAPFDPGDAARADAARFLVEKGLEGNPRVVFFQPFSSYEQKDWPLANQIELARRLARRGWQPLFGGAPNEIDRLRPVAEAGFPIAAGLSLMAMTALGARQALAFGTDTGLIHLIHASGGRVLVLRRYKNAFPHGHPEWAITAPDQGLVAAIPVDVAEARILSMLDGPR